MTRFAPAVLLLAMCALATASCQVTDSAQSDQSVPVASVSPGDPGQPANSSMTTLRNDYATQLSAAATDDTAREALAALNVYVDRNAALDSGAIPEYADQAAAQEALKRGEKPETNPAYEQALAEATSAHATLTTCMPHWPVVF